MTSTSSNTDQTSRFADLGHQIQKRLTEVVRVETLELATEESLKSEDVIKLMLGAQIFTLVDFAISLDVPQQILFDIMHGAFQFKDGIQETRN